MKKREIYLDMLNIVACFCVISMHCNGIVHTYSNTIPWKQSMFVETVAYWAVPVFFMMSGATLMNYRDRYNTKTYLTKRFTRVGIPFIAWSLINFIWKTYAGRIDIIWNIPFFISLFLNNKIENVYWFFAPLFACYLCIPVLSFLKDNRKMLWYMLLCGGLTYSVFPTVCQLIGLGFNSNLYFPMAGGYVIYLILGYLISTTELTKNQRCLLYVCAFGGAAFRFMSTVILSAETGELYRVFWGYMNFPTVFLATGIFVWFKYINWEKILFTDWLKRLVKKAASASFGIYLIHMITINGFYWIGINKYGLKWRVLGPAVIYLCSLLAVLIMKKIPGLKKIVP